MCHDQWTPWIHESLVDQQGGCSILKGMIPHIAATTKVDPGSTGNVCVSQIALGKRVHLIDLRCNGGSCIAAPAVDRDPMSAYALVQLHCANARNALLPGVAPSS